ncbi:putative F-box protein [Cardamine amara subsp. amara]|uniref:F-box protein n=1 Tax=Cardamine amara subsp. amara TaxID=228776 RepID=A0ABD0ZHF8_CARAN
MKKEEQNRISIHRKMEKEEEERIWIHMDLVIEILSRMPVKSLLKLKCLSKEFSRIIHSRNFVDSCLACSSNRSRLLFYFHFYEDNTLVFFSAPHRLTCSILPTRHDMTFRGVVGTSLRSPPVRGLIFCTFGPNQHVLCNPATKHNISLPQNQMLRKKGLVELLIFGYDPIFDQFKVLCISVYKIVKQPDQYQFWVLTVGKDGNIWRKIQGMPPHLVPAMRKHLCGQTGICINGVLYFKACSKNQSYTHPGNTTHVVSFDLNSEEFSLIKTNSHLTWFSKLIDFQGKLAFLSRVKDCTIEFCLLENKEWSSKVFHLPWAQKYSRLEQISDSVLGICDGEIIFVPPKEFGFTWHLSLEKKTTRKVDFHDFQIPSNRNHLVVFFSNYADTTVSL